VQRGDERGHFRARVLVAGIEHRGVVEREEPKVVDPREAVLKLGEELRRPAVAPELRRNTEIRSWEIPTGDVVVIDPERRIDPGLADMQDSIRIFSEQTGCGTADSM